MFIVSDILSLLPASVSGLAPPLQVGQKLPPEVEERVKEVVNKDEHRPIMIYVPRHCGCPFPERDLHHLYALISKNLSLFENAHVRILVLPHANTPQACQQWFDAVFDAAAAASKDTPKEEQYRRIKDLFHLIPDPAPSRTLAKSLSFGSLGTFGALFGRESLGEVMNLKKDRGIKNRETAEGSNRWTEHGAVWVISGSGDEGSIVKCVDKPAVASRECDWSKGWKEAGIEI
ncbi:hypothetical protein BDP27DRAFT_1443051 [Rhodocollybia butyracea]|uniref:Uncharacterized protein n=1 Tax=Rhodocollybia butyracea TaxID=206335 RepID=A0A9P5UE13_9AGAR|nr:hypothetical protein BDP27DRAFT_1443051 [Rhodocollybia butyracea]